MEEPTPQEMAVLSAIRENAFAGQQEIAAQLGLARSTVAAHIVQLMQKGHILGRAYVLPQPARALCIGGAVLDRKYRGRQPLISGTSNPVDGLRSLGGVARNVAENLARLGTSTSFVSVVGDDEGGRELLRYMRDRGIDVSQTMISAERPTAEYVAVIEPDGELAMGLADMGIFDLLQPDHLDRIWPHLASATWVFSDCNPPAEMLAALIARRQGASFRLAIDAVSTVKAGRLPKDLTGVDLLFMNIDEANSVLGRQGRTTIDDAREAAIGLQKAGASEAVVTMGAQGIAVAGLRGAKTFAAVKAVSVDMTGAGDAMIAGTLHRVMAGDDIYDAARTGALLGALTTESAASVHPDLSDAFLKAHWHRLPTDTKIDQRNVHVSS